MADNSTPAPNAFKSTPTVVTTFASIDALRDYKPGTAGELAVVLEYAQGTKMGGGVFVYDITDWQTPDDGGMTIVARGDMEYRWKRAVSSYNEVSVIHFGAVADGQTDCLEAVKLMWNWSQRQIGDSRPYENIGIRFPAGRYFISSFDIGSDLEDTDWDTAKFRLAGENVNFGYHTNTTLVSDTNSNYMFKVKARWVEITGLTIDGRSNWNGDRNGKGFFQNVDKRGQFLRVSAVTFNNLGGKALDIRDTLDCKIDQWYASGCHDTVINAGWTEPDGSEWDHVTAIELSNFNVQYGYDKPMLNVQRAGQSLMWNGWIEHCDDPGNISNGQWVINALNLEDNAKPLLANWSRVVMNQLSVQGGNDERRHGIDLSDTGDRWIQLSEYEAGHLHLENYGVRSFGAINCDYFSAAGMMDNNSDNPVWFFLGEMNLEQWRSMAHIRVLGTGFYNKMGDTQTNFDIGTAEGSADIYLQNLGSVDGRSTIQGTWSSIGSTPIQGVAIDDYANNMVKVYVELTKWTDQVRHFVSTTSPDHFDSGLHFRYTRANQKLTADEANALDLNSKRCYHQHWMGGENVGLGYNNNNELLFRGQIEDNQLIIRVNGDRYGIPLNRK